jgi:hypothetical protein
LGISPQQERELLSRLARRNLIVRVRRGLYLVPLRLPPGGKWGPNEFLALNTLVNDQGGRYQVCGPNAVYRYGWDTQVPNRIYADNNRITGQRMVGSVAMTLIKVPDQRLGETEVVRTPDGFEAVYCSRVRSLASVEDRLARLEQQVDALIRRPRRIENEPGPHEWIESVGECSAAIRSSKR